MMRPMPVRTVFARMLFVVGDRVLLASRRGEGWFFLPGGPVRPGQTIEQTLRRELREDTGLVARSLDFVGCHEHSYADPGGRLHRELDVVFAAHLGHVGDLVSRDDEVDLN